MLNYRAFFQSGQAASSDGFDTLIVGAGFAGSVMAERLATQAGQRVLLVDKRPHIGGNAYDRHDDAGILVHPYGPHIFHTNSRDVFEYLSRFTAWRPYQHRVLASVDGQLLPMPINLDTVNRLYGLSLTSFEMADFLASKAQAITPIKTSEDVVVSKIGRDLYEKFFRGYTRKQWALDPSELDASVTARVPTRTNRDDRYFTDTYQAMPLRGYTRMFESMLQHPRISVLLNTDYREVVNAFRWRHMIYTGPIDAFFEYRHGRLPYRSLQFEHVTLQPDQGRELVQAVGTINHPNDHAYTRVTEFKHLTGQQHAQTSLVYEYPRADGDPYYPVPRAENMSLYRRYESDAEQFSDVTFLGRLASYRYYNMDQVVAQALAAFKRGAAQRPAAAATDAAAAIGALVAATPSTSRRGRLQHADSTLIQILLPLFDASGKRFDAEQFDTVHRELVERFGGLTAYTRSPATGLWKQPSEHIESDDIVVVEVMADRLDHDWWREYRHRLERRFHQQTLLIRAIGVIVL